MKKDLVEHISNQLSLPPETLSALPLISLHGSYAVVLENHRGMIAYGPEEVCVKTKTGMVRVQGERLCIHCMTKKTLELRGKIHRVEIE